MDDYTLPWSHSTGTFNTLMCDLADIVQDPKNTALHHEWRRAVGREARSTGLLPKAPTPTQPPLCPIPPALYASPVQLSDFTLGLVSKGILGKTR